MLDKINKIYLYHRNIRQIEIILKKDRSSTKYLSYRNKMKNYKIKMNIPFNSY